MSNVKLCEFFYEFLVTVTSIRFCNSIYVIFSHLHWSFLQNAKPRKDKRFGICNVISPYTVRVKTVAREVARFHLDLVGVQVVRCGLHVTLCYFYKKLSCSYVTRSREWWRMKVRFIVADNIKIWWLTVEAVNSALSHFNISLLTTPTVKITVKSKCSNKKTVYTLGWKDRLPSGRTKSFQFMTK
jgi:hypothetical protein